MGYCKHWNDQTYYCGKKDKTINPADLFQCDPKCAGYSSLKSVETKQLLTCAYCGQQFSRTNNNVVEIQNQELGVQCPSCGNMGITPQDNKLFDGKSGSHY